MKGYPTQIVLNNNESGERGGGHVGMMMERGECINAGVFFMNSLTCPSQWPGGYLDLTFQKMIRC